jgi:adenylate cyclase
MSEEPPAEQQPGAATSDDEALAGTWRKILVEGNEPLRRAHVMFRHLPGPPRCKLCHSPFGGVGGRFLGFVGFKPSRKNPNLCARCCDSLPPGGLELDIAVLFADVRGSTALSEQVGAASFAKLLNNFYRAATGVLIRHDAIIDKLIGDEVMALFIPGIAGPSYRQEAATAAVELLDAVGQADGPPVGAAVAAGIAYVGNVGSLHVVDFTALGDPVNMAARLQAQAAAGEVLVADDVLPTDGDQWADAETRTLDVRGHDGSVQVRVLRPS